MAKRKTQGRPRSSKNRKYSHADGQLTRCPKCGSTERAAYTSKHEQRHDGFEDGRRYTHIIRRRTHCLECGQHRIDRHTENRPQKK